MTDKELDALIGAFSARFTLIQRKYLRRVGERLKRIGALSAKDIHILSELRRMGTEMDEIQREISRACGVSKEQLFSALELAAKADTRAAEMKLKGTDEAEEGGDQEGRIATPSARDDAAFGSLTLTPGLRAAVEAQAKVTAGEFDNLSQTTVQDGFYRHVIDAAAGAVTSGVDDYAGAIRGAVKTLAANGLRVVYESGYTRRLDSAVRQNVLDAARAVSQAATDEVGRQLGADGVQISAHILCAPDHLPYQGRMYSNEEFEAIQESLDRPFGMWNCRHIWYPAILGVTKQTYSEDTLTRYADLSNGKVKIGGRELTRYEWTQEQRKIETKLRDLRAEEAVWLAAGNTEELNRVRAEIRRLTAVYNLITREASVPSRMERTEGVQGLTEPQNNVIIKSQDKAVDDDVHIIATIQNKAVFDRWGDVSPVVVLTNERIAHIREGHERDYMELGHKMPETIEKPNLILEDAKNENTAMFIKHIDDTNLNVIVRLQVRDDRNRSQSSVITMYKMGAKTLTRLLKKNKTLYKSE
ncbi:MAG: hypothetical protein K5663_11335 [Clostridiales bacterium]|nr:hypothetical protein [Clostridiales bacterium]